MAEPSLRDTTAQAIGRAYWRSQGQPARAVRASEWYPEADAALRVIHTQRDVIIDAIACAEGVESRREWDAREFIYGPLADAVLATLGAESDRATA